MMTSTKEVNKHFGLAKWHFKRAIELAKSNLIIGEVTFPAEKKVRAPRKPRATEPTEKEGL
jgi:hypothetical protein